jgi:fermentation-respiration switch protein FrsA (DUF1100 family)
MTVIAGSAVLLLVLLWWFQRCLIYFPDPVAPAALPPGGEAVAFTTEDGLSLAGWFVPAQGGRARGTVLVFNGNAGNRAHRAPLATTLAREGLSVLLFDYRGFGGNPGSPAEWGLLADARAARDYLASRPDVDAGRLVFYGESLGTGVAVALAAEQTPAALVLRSPFPSMTDVGRRHYWYLPVDLLLWDRYPAREQIRRVAAPVLVIAGSGDRLIPPDLSRQLYDAVPGPKAFVLVPGADHADPRLQDGPEVMPALRRFLDTNVGPVKSPAASAPPTAPRAAAQ